MSLGRFSGGPGGDGLPYTGIATFLGWPLLAERRARAAGGRELVAVGVPYDEGTAYRSGARLAPRAIRDASMRLRFATADGLNVYDIERRASLSLGVRAWDGGDVDVTPQDQQRTFAAISEAVQAIRSVDATPIVLGGDNSITYPVLRGVDEPEVVVIALDAHLDYGAAYFGVEHGNSTPLRAARSRGHCRQVIHLGVRGYDNSASDLQATESDGNIVVSADACRTGEATRVIAALRPGTLAYVSLDIDVADPAIAPGTGYLEPGGLDYTLLRELLIAVGSRCKLVGCELVEVSPAYDAANVTALLGTQLLVDLLSSWSPPGD